MTAPDVEKLTRYLDQASTLLGDLELPLATVQRDDGVRHAGEIASQLGDYVLPRLSALDAPVLVVVGGSTGAGKSTLVNALVGENVSTSGVLRPTTRTPVLIHHPDDASWFTSAKVLPDVARVGKSSNVVYAIRHVVSENVMPGVGILDAPDFDSIDVGNRALADQLLAAADLWLFVTSAARYADQVPWDYLRRAATRSASVAVVLDRTDPEQLPTVLKDLARLMAAHGLSDSPLFSVPESTFNEQGLLEPEHVADINNWLIDLATDAAERRRVVGSTLDGAIRQINVKLRSTCEVIDEQADTAAELAGDATRIFTDAGNQLVRDVSDGALMRGEVLARWQEFVGTGELFRSLEVKVGRLRDWLFGAKPAHASSTEDVEAAVGTGLHLLILDRAEQAAADTARAWSDVAAGAELLAANRSLDRASRDVQTRAERLAREWRAAVFELVEAEAGGKKAKARAMTWGVNAVGVSLMVVVFAGTAGLTGAEVGIAGGTAAISHRVLQAVFGDQAVRELARAAQADLQARVEALFAQESDRYLEVLPSESALRSLVHDLTVCANEIETERLIIDFVSTPEEPAPEEPAPEDATREEGSDS
jgi:energy-coupling factor transporter ATP-binding protein EcfA2